MLAIGVECRLDRQGLDPRLEILLVLVAVDVELLAKVALVVKQAHRDERDAEAAGALNVVAGEHAETSRVDRHRFVDPELGGEVDDRLRSKHARVYVAPGRLLTEILLHPAVRLVDPAVEHELCRPGFEPLWRELREQRDRIVVKLPPANWIEFAKQVGHLRVPAPPEVAGQRHAFVVEVLRREFVEPRWSGDDGGAVRGRRGNAAAG